MTLIADSGSTKTDWWLVGREGVGLRIATEGINPIHQTESDIWEILERDVAPGVGGAARRVSFYGSGVRSEERPKMEGLLRRAFPGATVEAHSDMLGAARALLGRREGIACILGTGANSCLYDGEKISKNTPPLGYILGDEGSGAVLGKAFINAVFKGGLPTETCDSFLKESGLTLEEIIQRVYREPLANRFLASLSPLIHSRLGVPEVESLVTACFRDFFRRNIAPYGRRDLPIGAVGSVAFHYAAQLRAAAQAEGFRVETTVKSPMEGLANYHQKLSEL